MFERCANLGRVTSLLSLGSSTKTTVGFKVLLVAPVNCLLAIGSFRNSAFGSILLVQCDFFCVVQYMCF